MIILFNSRTPEFAWLSNFYMCPFKFNGGTWPSAEHAYQAMKFEGSFSHYHRIHRAKTTYEAKQLGKFPEMVSNWDSRKLDVMAQIIHAKFQAPHLRTWLQDTAPHELVHLAGWDNYWGNGPYGKGLNHLGKILMEERNT